MTDETPKKGINLNITYEFFIKAGFLFTVGAIGAFAALLIILEIFEWALK